MLPSSCRVPVTAVGPMTASFGQAGSLSLYGQYTRIFPPDVTQVNDGLFPSSVTIAYAMTRHNRETKGGEERGVIEARWFYRERGVIEAR